MKWDAGALAKNPNNSPIFRFLSNDPSFTFTWPKRYLQELGIFLATPGVSWRWVTHNLNMGDKQLLSVFNQTKDLHYLGVENVVSATHDDAYYYMNRRVANMNMPFWVRPFILADIKKQWTVKQVCDKWNIGSGLYGSIKNDKSGNLFHPSKKRGLWGNVDRRF